MYWGMVCGDGLAAGQSAHIPGSDDARLMVAHEPTLQYMEPVVGEVTVRSPTFDIDYSHVGAPSTVSESDVRAAMERATAQYKNLMPSEAFAVTIRVRWEDLAGTALMQTSQSGRDSRSWNVLDGINGHLQDSYYGSADQDSYENPFISNLPAGTTVPYKWGSNNTTSTATICLPIPLLKKWYGAASGDPIEITIDSTLPENTKWDAKASLFNKLAPNSFDFEGAFLHEVGHGLGFWSELEPAQSFFYNIISNWDLFRFETAQAPINAGEFMSTERNLRPSIPACGCTELSNSSSLLCFELARGRGVTGGDEEQASHWKDRNLKYDPDHYIGIMDTAQDVDEYLVTKGKYLQDADVRAFDLLGYEIDINSVIAGVESVPTTVPANNATVAAGALTVSWGTATNATSYDIYVDCGSCLVTYVQRDISGTSHTIPTGILQNGAYTIVVISRNWRGLASTPINITVTPSCPADFDLDGFLTGDDYDMFVDTFTLGGSAADFNLDGFVNGDDFDAYVVAFEAGC